MLLQAVGHSTDLCAWLQPIHKHRGNQKVLGGGGGCRERKALGNASLAVRFASGVSAPRLGHSLAVRQAASRLLLPHLLGQLEQHLVGPGVERGRAVGKQALLAVGKIATHLCVGQRLGVCVRVVDTRHLEGGIAQVQGNVVREVEHAQLAAVAGGGTGGTDNGLGCPHGVGGVPAKDREGPEAQLALAALRLACHLDVGALAKARSTHKRNRHVAKVCHNHLEKKPFLFIMAKTKTIPVATTKSVELAALVLEKISTATSGNGPVYGFVDEDAKVLRLTHAYQFPQLAYHENYDNFTKLRANAKFTAEYSKLLADLGEPVEFVGWYVTCKSAGRFMTPQLVESLYKQALEQGDLVVVVNNRFNGEAGLSLKAFRLNERFVKLYADLEERFVTKSVEEAELKFDNLFVEIPVSYVELAVAGVLAQPAAAQFQLLVLNNKPEGVASAFEHLFDLLDDVNYDLNNYNYFQRNQLREMHKAKAWVRQQEQDGVASPDWEKSGLFKMPHEPLRFEGYVLGNLVRATCSDLVGECEGEFIKGAVVVGQQPLGTE